jgi:hypothetical protein
LARLNTGEDDKLEIAIISADVDATPLVGSKIRLICTQHEWKGYQL